MSIQMGSTIDNAGPFSNAPSAVGYANRPKPMSTGPAEPMQNGPKPSQGHVQFSDSVALLQRVQGLIDATPVVDSPRVESTRMALDSGSYQINPSAIADKMIAFDRELP